MSEALRILVIGAHPADVFDSCAGTIVHHTARGDWVAGVSLTHGVRKHDKEVVEGMQRRESVPEAESLRELIEERAEVKAGELRKISDFLGMADLILLGGDDAVVLIDKETVRQLASLIREHKPDLIITHFPKEEGGTYSQHAVTGQMVMQAVELATGPDPGDRNPPHYVAQVFFFGPPAHVRSTVWKSEGGYWCDVFVETTDVIEKKIACLDMLNSQAYGGSYARKIVEVCDGAFGKAVYVPYAEGFISWRASIQYCLGVSDIQRRLYKTSDHERRVQRSYMVGNKESKGQAGEISG